MSLPSSPCDPLVAIHHLLVVARYQMRTSSHYRVRRFSFNHLPPPRFSLSCLAVPHIIPLFLHADLLPVMQWFSNALVLADVFFYHPSLSGQIKLLVSHTLCTCGVANRRSWGVSKGSWAGKGTDWCISVRVFDKLRRADCGSSTNRLMEGSHFVLAHLLGKKSINPKMIKYSRLLSMSNE